MSDLNKAMIIGRLTKDPEAKNLQSGKIMSVFSLATNKSWKDKSTGEKNETAEYHNIIVFGKLAEICNQYLNKGKRVFIEGRLQTRSWENQNGDKRYTTEIIAENMMMLDGAKNSSNQTEQVSSNQTQTQEQELPRVEIEEEINIEDIPF